MTRFFFFFFFFFLFFFSLVESMDLKRAWNDKFTFIVAKIITAVDIYGSLGFAKETGIDDTKG